MDPISFPWLPRKPPPGSRSRRSVPAEGVPTTRRPHRSGRPPIFGRFEAANLLDQHMRFGWNIRETHRNSWFCTLVGRLDGDFFRDLNQQTSVFQPVRVRIWSCKKRCLMAFEHLELRDLGRSIEGGTCQYPNRWVLSNKLKSTATWCFQISKLSKSRIIKFIMWKYQVFMVFPSRAFSHSVDLRAAETGETSKGIWTSTESTNHRRPEQTGDLRVASATVWSCKLALLFVRNTMRV